MQGLDDDVMPVAKESHDWMLPAADSGCITIADISGYTRYLGATELEHAQDVLSDLMDSVVSGLRQVLHISHLEGDAALAYALDEEVEASMLLDTVEETYYSFRARRRDITHSTTCDCNACARIPQLDLKFISHHGQFVRKDVEGRTELTGNDVIVAHSLLKNQVKEEFETDAYHLVTEACVEALGMDPEALSMKPHHEKYEDVGQIWAYVTDLEERWRYEQERRRVFIVPSEAELEFVDEYPAPRPIVWEYVTSPRKRVEWQGGVDRVDQDNPGGRQGVGTTNHCVHGSTTFREQIIDWRPFQYFTKRVIRSRLLGPWTITVEFRALGEGTTEVRTRGKKLSGLHRVVFNLFKARIAREMAADAKRLRALLETDSSSTAQAASE